MWHGVLQAVPWWVWGPSAPKVSPSIFGWVCIDPARPRPTPPAGQLELRLAPETPQNYPLHVM